MLDADPVLVEPYLFSYWLRLHKFDGEPILAKIRADEFDVVVTMAQPQGYRGIPHVGPQMRSAIESAYQPYCVCSDFLFHLPVHRTKNATLETRLNGIGCTRLQCDQPISCTSW
jgi:hypothetical protein